MLNAQTTKIELHDVAWNPTEEKFEGMVHFHRDGRVEKVVVEASLRIDADAHDIRRVLLADARARRMKGERPASRILPPAQAGRTDMRFALTQSRHAA